MTTPHSGATHNSTDLVAARTPTLPRLLDDRSRVIAGSAYISPNTCKRSLYDQQILDRFPKDTRSSLIHSSTSAERTQSVPPSIADAARPRLDFYFQSLVLPPPFPGVLPITFRAEKGLDVSGNHKSTLCTL